MGFKEIEKIKEQGIISDDAEIAKLEKELCYLSDRLDKGRNDDSRRAEVRDGLIKVLRRIDRYFRDVKYIEGSLRRSFNRLEAANKEFGDDLSTDKVNKLRIAMDEAIRKQDKKIINDIKEDVDKVYWQLTLLYHLMDYIQYYDYHFDKIEWRDKIKARQLVNEGLAIISEKPSSEKLHPIFWDLYELIIKREDDDIFASSKEIRKLLKKR